MVDNHLELIVLLEVCWRQSNNQIQFYTDSLEELKDCFRIIILRSMIIILDIMSIKVVTISWVELQIR